MLRRLLRSVADDVDDDDGSGVLVMRDERRRKTNKNGDMMTHIPKMHRVLERVWRYHERFVVQKLK